MSLIDSMMDDFILMDKSRRPDGEGGFIIAWEEGAPFRAALTLDSTMEAQIAQAQGVSSVYTVTTARTTILEYQDVIKRVSDGRHFRITTEKGETVSPAVSSLDMAQYRAEKWRLT